MNCSIRTSYETWQVELDLINKHLNFLNPFKTPYWFNTYYLVYLLISKAKQFSRQPKKIQESDENMQEQDKEYLIKQNADLLTNGLVNKTIEEDVDNIFN